MKIFLKQIFGGTITIDILENSSMLDLARQGYEKRQSQHKNMTFLQYACAVKYIHAGRDLDWSKNLTNYNICDFSTINEIGKS